MTDPTDLELLQPYCPICGMKFRGATKQYQLIGHASGEHGWVEALTLLQKLDSTKKS